MRLKFGWARANFTFDKPVVINVELEVRFADRAGTAYINRDSVVSAKSIRDEANYQVVLYAIPVGTEHSVLIGIINDSRWRFEELPPSRSRYSQ